jgi:hypothetical protein
MNTTDKCWSQKQIFAAIDHEGAFLDYAETLANSIDRIPGFADCVAEVSKFITTPIDQRNADILRAIKLPAVYSIFDGQPPESAIFGATIHRIASTMFSNHGSFATITERLQDGSTVDAIRTFIANNPCFVGELMVESALRANRDKKFLTALSSSIQDVQETSAALLKSSGGSRIFPLWKGDPGGDSDGGLNTDPSTSRNSNSVPAGCAIGSSSTKGETATCVMYTAVTVALIILCIIFC